MMIYYPGLKLEFILQTLEFKVEKSMTVIPYLRFALIYILSSLT